MTGIEHLKRQLSAKLTAYEKANEDHLAALAAANAANYEVRKTYRELCRAQIILELAEKGLENGEKALGA